MKNYILSIALFLFSTSLLLATPITGIVKEPNGTPIPGVHVELKSNHNIHTTSDFDGKFQMHAAPGQWLVFSMIGYETKEVKVGKSNRIIVVLNATLDALEEVVIIGHGNLHKKEISGAVNMASMPRNSAFRIAKDPIHMNSVSRIEDNESYAEIDENGFQNPLQNPLSTFSIDVDAASYSNVRRFITQGQKPPKDAVRIEELINYFNYDYKQPKGKTPFSIHTELAACPWNTDNQLLHIGLQGKTIDTKDAPASNLVFLLDVSGSMRSPNKLPLLKKAYTLLVQQMRAKDKVAIVVYAGSSGIVLPSTSGAEKAKIIAALNQLQAGGGTAGAVGLELAYQLAEENFIKDGNNRIILATDGDFNLGPSSDKAMETLIEAKRKKGIFISVTGFGMGNYKDSKMEIIADKGNGNYSYIDNLLEAQKVFINEFGGTLHTLAKDVKIQIEFNPALVKKYRLIGYENRLLAAEDFQNDAKDAGELGAGHTVTALYEIVPTSSKVKDDTDLKYQQTKTSVSNDFGDELATVKFRYKQPKATKSRLLEKVIENKPVDFDKSSENFQFASAVAGFGMLLRDSDYQGDLSYEQLIHMATEAKGVDSFGYRSEFIRLLSLVEQL